MTDPFADCAFQDSLQAMLFWVIGAADTFLDKAFDVEECPWKHIHLRPFLQKLDKIFGRRILKRNTLLAYSHTLTGQQRLPSSSCVMYKRDGTPETLNDVIREVPTLAFIIAGLNDRQRHPTSNETVFPLVHNFPGGNFCSHRVCKMDLASKAFIFAFKIFLDFHLWDHLSA